MSSGTGNFRDQLAASLEEGGPEIIAKLREVLDGGGIVNRRMTCEHCGQSSTVQVQITDTRTTLEVAKFFTEQGLGKAATAPVSDLEGHRTELERQIANHKRELQDLTDDELHLLCAGDPKTLQESLDSLKAKWQEADTLTKAGTVRYLVQELLQTINTTINTWGPRHDRQSVR